MPAKSTRLDFAGGRGLVVCYAGNSVALIAAAIAVRIKSLRDEHVRAQCALINSSCARGTYAHTASPVTTPAAPAARPRHVHEANLFVRRGQYAAWPRRPALVFR